VPAVPASMISQRRLVRKARSPISCCSGPEPFPLACLLAPFPLTCPPVKADIRVAACSAFPCTWTW
jgi:hypothetical protein